MGLLPTKMSTIGNSCNFHWWQSHKQAPLTLPEIKLNSPPGKSLVVKTQLSSVLPLSNFYSPFGPSTPSRTSKLRTFYCYSLSLTLIFTSAILFQIIMTYVFVCMLRIYVTGMEAPPGLGRRLLCSVTETQKSMIQWANEWIAHNW